MTSEHALSWAFILICLAVALIAAGLAFPSRPAHIAALVAGSLATIFAAIAAFA